VRGLENFPAGGALVVCNHSGGLFPMDVPIFAADFYDRFGYDRPVYTLSHAMLMIGPTGDFFKKTGFILASHENADEALRSGGVVVVFPVATTTSTAPPSRPTRSTSTVARATCGPPSTQACRSCRWSGSAGRRPSCTCPAAPGWPSGWARSPGWPGPRSSRCPSASVRAVRRGAAERAAARQDHHAGTAPVHIEEQFGEEPDIDEVDAHVRHVMQGALDELAAERRLPVIG
jgi:1-acyl-sn-glycerol-3-phosphate acyltransferase